MVIGRAAKTILDTQKQTLLKLGVYVTTQLKLLSFLFVLVLHRWLHHDATLGVETKPAQTQP